MFGSPKPLAEAPAIESIPPAEVETVDCDLCSARSRVAITFTTEVGGIALITFCNHHGRELHDAILRKHPDAVFTGFPEGS